MSKTPFTDTRLVHVTVPIADIDWPRIALFRKRFAEVWDNFRDLKIGQLTGSFSRQTDGSYSGSFNLPNHHRLKGLYVDFRHFYSNNEPTNAHAFAKYLATLVTDNDYRQFLKEQRQKLRSAFIEDGWFKHKGNDFSTKQILDIWFNAEIFHNDTAKSATLLDWTETLATDTGRSLLFMAVMDSLMVIRNINWSCAELSATNPKLRMPKNTATGIIYTNYDDDS